MKKQIDAPVTNPTTVAFVEFPQPTSMKDAAYRFDRGLRTNEHIAAWILVQEPGFAEKQSEGTLNGLVEGFALSWQEDHEAVEYDANYEPKVGGGFIVSLAFALSFSQQAYGQFRVSEPAKHKAIGAVRVAFSGYKSNRLKKVIATVKGLTVKTKTRAVTANFDAWANAQLIEMVNRAKTAVSRGDKTAHEEKVKRANAAWLAEFKK